MTTVMVDGKDLRVGDVIEVWWQPRREQITRLEPYSGPFDFICCVARFALSPTGMSIGRNQRYTVLNRTPETELPE